MIIILLVFIILWCAKINETSSESSEPFDFPITNIDMEKSLKKSSIPTFGGEALRETRRSKTLNKINNIQNNQIETENDNNSKPKTVRTKSNTRKNDLKFNQTKLNDPENVNKNTCQPKTLRSMANTKRKYLKSTENLEVPSTSLLNEKSIKHRETQRSKTLNKVNNIQTKFNKNENLNNKNSKPRTVRTSKSTHNLEDQCMRGTVAEVLNTSLVIEEPWDNITEAEPAIKKLKVKTIIDEEKLYVSTDRLPKKINKKKDNKVEKHSDQDSESPFQPSLIVEKAQVHREADDSVKSVLVDNSKDMSGFNTTKNLTNNRSAPKSIRSTPNPQTNNKRNKSVKPKQNSKFKAKRYMTETLPNNSRDNHKNKSKTKACSGSEKAKRQKLSTISEVTHTGMKIEDNSDESILTTGKSPITARGGLEGAPPNVEQLNQPITPRNLDIEYLSQSTQDFSKKLQLTLNTLNVPCTKEVCSNDNSPEKLITIVIDESPSAEMTKWQPTLASASSQYCTLEGVQNWLYQNDSGNPTEIQLLREHLEHMQEKLNTTLVEMQHASCKKFISMLVDAHQNANERKAERRRLCQGLIADVHEKHTTKRLKDLEIRFEELERQSIKNMEQKFEKIVCDECEQRKTMLTLLQDDLDILLKRNETKND